MIGPTNARWVENEPYTVFRLSLCERGCKFSPRDLRAEDVAVMVANIMRKRKSHIYLRSSYHGDMFKYVARLKYVRDGKRVFWAHQTP